MDQDTLKTARECLRNIDNGLNIGCKNGSYELDQSFILKKCVLQLESIFKTLEDVQNQETKSSQTSDTE